MNTMLTVRKSIAKIQTAKNNGTNMIPMAMKSITKIQTEKKSGMNTIKMGI